MNMTDIIIDNAGVTISINICSDSIQNAFPINSVQSN